MNIRLELLRLPRPNKGTAAIILTVIALVAGLSAVPGLLSIENLTQVFRQVSVQATIAMGMTFVILAGRLDLSLGSLLSLCAVAVVGLHNVVGPAAAMAICIALGAFVGCINGFLVAVLRLNSLIATLGMLSILQGAALVLTGGRTVGIAMPEATWFAVIGRGYMLGIPVPVVLVVALAILLALLLGRSGFGRRIYAVGGNETASRFSSINAKQVLFRTYVIAGVLTAVAAIILGSRLMNVRNDTGAGYELSVLAGIILGGTSLFGGSGGIVRSVFGVIVLGLIQNALLLLGMPYYFQWIITWMVIIIAVWANLATRRGTIFT